MDEKFKLKKLFYMFGVNYKELWTQPLQGLEEQQANEMMWSFALKDFSEDVILDAGMEAISRFEFPPKVSQIVEIAKAIKRGREPDYRLLMASNPSATHRSPPSRHLAEYMRKHGIADDASGLKNFKDDPVFQELRTHSKGGELGKALVKEICRRVRLKNAQPR